jgi:GAF domain-containing protein
MSSPDRSLETTERQEEERLLAQARRHAVEMASLHEMAAALALAVDLEEMLGTVLRQVRRTLESDLAFVSLASADGRALRIEAAEGENAAELLGLEFPVDQGINAWIYREGKPALIDDADADPRRLHIRGRTEAVRAAIGAPLKADGTSIGTIYAARYQPHTFAESHLSILTIMASQVAAAVQRARLLEQAKRRAEEMETLLNIGVVMASSLDPGRVLQAVYEQAGRIMDTSAFFVALYAPARDELRFELVYELGERLEPFSVRLAESQGLTAYVVRTGQPLLIHNWELERDRLPIDPLIVGEPTLSWLGVPIVAQDRVVGAVGSQSFEPYAFTHRHARLLSAIANQAGISLENAHLYEAMEQMHQDVAQERDKLVHLHRVFTDVQRVYHPQAKMQLVADGIEEVGWGCVVVSLCSAGQGLLELACAGCLPEDEVALRAGLLSIQGCQRRFRSEFESFRRGQCYYLPGNDPWVREQVLSTTAPMPESSDPGAWHPDDILYLPLCGRDGRTMGFIDLAKPRDGRRPTATSLHIIELFAQETALAIENAQLLNDLKLVNTDLQEMVDAQAHLLQTIEEMIPALNLEEGPDILRRLAGGKRQYG